MAGNRENVILPELIYRDDLTADILLDLLTAGVVRPPATIPQRGRGK